MSDTIAFIVQLPGKPEHSEELEQRLLGVLDAMSKEPDFVSTHLHRSTDDPETFVLYEVWACSRDHFMAHHLDKPYRRDFEARLPQLLREARRIDFLAPLTVYGREKT